MSHFKAGQKAWRTRRPSVTYRISGVSTRQDGAVYTLRDVHTGLERTVTDYELASSTWQVS